ncbi:rRNA primary transcript metabolism protein [Chytridiales sp. JEL 0842]|nr:rRNA primary transcript metabolism protein [Chytridiales sp. JEL 0842]
MATETISKFLHGSKAGAASVEEKIQFAVATWNDDRQYVPGKANLLLDWVTSAMMRSCNNNQRFKNQATTFNRESLEPYMRVDHWSFLVSLLESFASKSSRSFSLKLSIQPALSAAVLDGAKALTHFVNDADPSSSSYPPYLLELLQQTSASYKLITKDLIDVVRLTADQHMNLLSDIFDATRAIMEFLDTCPENSTIISLANTAASLLHDTMSTFKHLHILQSNLKKSFTYVCTKLLDNLLHFYSRINTPKLSFTYLHSETSTSLQTLITATIKDGLFHREHLLEIPTLLVQLTAQPKSEQGKKEIFSYHKQLFDRLNSLTTGSDTKQSAYVLSILPTLLDIFLSERRRVMKSQVDSATSDVDFSFFVTTFSVVWQSLENPDQCSNLALILSVANAGLMCLHKHGVYRATQEESSVKHRKFFAESMTTLWKNPTIATKAEHIDTLFVLSRTISLFDHNIVVDTLQYMWPHILKVSNQSNQEMIAFITQLVETMTKARELDTFIRLSLDVVLNYDGQIPTTFYLLSDAFMRTISQCASKTLPAQNLEILENLTGRLATCMSAPTNNKIKSIKGNDNTPHRVSQTKEAPCASLPALLFARILSTTQFHPAQLPRLGRILASAMQQFVEPVFASLQSKVDQQQPTTPSTRKRKLQTDEPTELLLSNLRPAALVYKSLIESPTSFWTERVSTADVDKLLRLCKSYADVTHEEKLALVHIALIHIQKVASGSALYTLDPQLQNVAHRIFELSFSQLSAGGVWARKSPFEKADAESIVLVLRYLPPLCQLGSRDHLNTLLFLIFRAVQDEELFGDLLMVKEICATMCDPTFYELLQIRDIFLPAFRESLIHKLKTMFASESNGKMPPELDLLQKISHSKESIDLVSAYFESENSNNENSLAIPMGSLKLLEILNLFPPTYFTSPEKETLIQISLVLESLTYKSIRSASTAKQQQDLLYQMVVCRRVAARCLSNRDDNLTALLSLPTYEWYLVTFESLNGVMNMDTFGSLQLSILDCTTSILEVITRKVMNVLGGNPTKNTQEEMLRFIGGIAKMLIANWDSSDRANNLMLSFITPLLDWLNTKAKRTKIDSSVDVPDSLQTIRSAVYPMLAEIESMVVINFRERLEELDETIKNQPSELSTTFSCIALIGKLCTNKKVYSMTTEHAKSEYCLQMLLDALEKFLSFNNKQSNNDLIKSSALIISILVDEMIEGLAESDDMMVTIVKASWFLMSITWKDDTDAVVKLLADALSSLARKLSPQQLQKLIHFNVRALNKRNAKLMDIVVVHTLVAIVSGAQKGGRTLILKRNLQNICINLGNAAQINQDSDYHLQCIHLMQLLTDDKMIEMNSTDISIILSTCSAFLSPSLAAASSLTSSNAIAALAVARLLLSLLSGRKKYIVFTLPAFDGIVVSLISLLRQSKQSLSAAQASSDTADIFDHVVIQDVDLATSIATTLSRLFEKIAQRGSNASGPSNSKNDSGVNTDAQLGPFTKHAAYLLSDIVGMQVSRTPLLEGAKAALREGVFTLLDLCGSYGRDAILAGMNSAHGSSAGTRTVFKNLVKEWERYHQFTGKV